MLEGTIHLLRHNGLVRLSAGVLCGFAFGVFVGRDATIRPQSLSESTNSSILVPHTSPLPDVALKNRPNGDVMYGTGNQSAQAVPRLNELSKEALARINLSCLRPDLTIDPLLAELANLDPKQLTDLQALIMDHQRDWSNSEAERCIAVADERNPKVIIPPSPDSAADAETRLVASVESIVGNQRLGIVWSSLSSGLRQATGDFGRLPRMISFERNPQEGSEEPLRVRVSLFDYGKDSDAIGDWRRLAELPPTKMESYAFRDLPIQFAPFVEKKHEN